MPISSILDLSAIPAAQRAVVRALLKEVAANGEGNDDAQGSGCDPVER